MNGRLLSICLQSEEDECRLTLNAPWVEPTKVGLRRAVGGFVGESQVSNDFLKIVDKTPDDRRWARGKPGWVDKLESLFALADYRPSLRTLTFEGGDCTGDYCTEVAAHALGGLP